MAFHQVLGTTPEPAANSMIDFAGSDPDDVDLDSDFASQCDGGSADQQDNSELNEDDDPLSGKTFDMSDDEGADDQSIPSGDDDSPGDDSPDDSSPEAPAEAQGKARPKANAIAQKGDSFSPSCL